MKNSTVSKTSQEHKQLILFCEWNSAQGGNQHKIVVHVWATDCQSCVILLSHICCMWGLHSWWYDCKTEVKGLWALPDLSQGFSGRATSPHSAMAPVAKTNQVLPRLPANPAHVQCQGSEAGLPKPGASQAHFASRQNINTSLLKSTNPGSLCSWLRGGSDLLLDVPRWRRSSYWAEQCDLVAQYRFTRKWLIITWLWPVQKAEPGPLWAVLAQALWLTRLDRTVLCHAQN